MTPPDITPSADPRARAAKTKRDRTRRALLDAADSIFGTRGWARTRMEDVALAAGVSAATAYNHFPTKHALVGHVFGPIIAPLAVQAERDVAAGRSVVDAVKDQVAALARISKRHHTLTAAFWSAVEEYALRGDPSSDVEDEGDPRLLAPVPDALVILFHHGQAIGEFRSYPPAGEMSATAVNMLLMRSFDRPDESAGELTELLLTVIFGTLKPELLMGRASDQRPFRSVH